MICRSPRSGVMKMFGWRVSARKARSERERVLSEFAGERRLQSDASTKSGLEPKGDGGDRYGHPTRLPRKDDQIVIEVTPRTHEVHRDPLPLCLLRAINEFLR